MVQAPILLTPIDPSEVVPANGNRLGFFAGTDGLYHLVQSNGEIDTLATDDAVEAVAEVFDFRAPRVTEAGSGGSVTVNIVHGHENNAVASDLYGCLIAGGGIANWNNVIGAGVSQIGTHPLDNGGEPITGTRIIPETGTGANLAFIAGGYHNVAGGLASTVIGYHNGTDKGTTHGTTSGGSWNWIVGGSYYGTISGGTANRLSGDNATIVGGRSNQASGDNCVVGGASNNVSGNGSVALGMSNAVTSGNSFAFGQSHEIGGAYSGGLGRQTKTVTQGQVAFSGSARANAGDSQGSFLTLRRQTTDATQTTLGVAGGNTGHIVREGQVIAVTGTIVAVEPSTMECAKWTIDALVRRSAGGNSLTVAPTNVTKTHNTTNAANWTAALSAASAAGAIVVRGTGEAGKTINWVAVLMTAEVM